MAHSGRRSDFCFGSMAGAALVLSFLDDRPALILAPAMLVWQWQEELEDKLGIPAAVWSTQKKCWLDAERRTLTQKGDPEFVAKCPWRIGIVSTGLIVNGDDNCDCLTDEEDNVAGFALFLANDVGAPLRLDNLQPIAQALSSDRLVSPWRRDRANDALVQLADVTLAKNARGLLQNTAARDGLVAIVAGLTARQVPGALTLQERVMQLR